MHPLVKNKTKQKTKNKNENTWQVPPNGPFQWINVLWLCTYLSPIAYSWWPPPPPHTHTPLFLILLFPSNPTSGILAKMTSFSCFYQSKNCLNTWRFPPCSKKALKKKKKKSPSWVPLCNKKIPLWCIKCVQTSWIHHCHVSKNDLFLKILWLLWLWLFAPPGAPLFRRKKIFC